MTQGILPFKYEEEKKSKNLTGLSGLLLFVELFQALKLDAIIGRHLEVKKDKQGWQDSEIILFLVLLNLAGGSSVSDIAHLESDEGFCRILKMIQLRGKIGRRRNQIKRRWRKEKRNTTAAPSSIFRYLSNFINGVEEKKREMGQSFIPAPNHHLRGFGEVNFELLDFVQRHDCQSTATLDMDATFSETYKEDALYSYKGGKAYQGFNVYWNEHDMVLHTEFRDGNVEPGYEQFRILKESLSQLPVGVEKVYVRSDSAGYQHDLMRYCYNGENERFGRIGFAIGCDITAAFREAILMDKDIEWHPIYNTVNGKKEESGQEWADVCFVPMAISRSKKGPDYKYIAIREELKERALPGMEDCLKLPFPVLQIERKNYKVSAFVTNLDWDEEELIGWYRKRCGKSEEVHSIMKEDLSGGKFPSGAFGANAAWWWIMILALNINSIMRHLVLGNKWKNKRLKAIRFGILNIPGRVVKKGKGFIVRLPKSHPSFGLLVSARQRIMELACLPLPSG